MSEHSIISPSSASCWVECAMYITMERLFPESDKHAESRIDGQTSHELGALLIKRATQALMTRPEVGDQSANGVALTTEMIDGARLYANNVIWEMQARGIFIPHVEELVECKEIHPQSWGTPDCWLYDPKDARLILWDYKFGFLKVEAFENWQAVNYFSGIADLLKIDGVSDQNLTVDIRIVQPRAYHRKGTIRSWVVKASDLRPYVNRLSGSAIKALLKVGTPPAVSGKQCVYCRGRHVCESALTAGVQLLEVATNSAPLDITPHALGVQLLIVRRAIEQLTALDTGYTEAIGSLIKRGAPVPYWTSAPSAGKEEWTAPIETILAMADLMGVDIKKPSIKTPKQARTAGIPDAVVQQYSQRKSSYKLEPVNANETKEIFK